MKIKKSIKKYSGIFLLGITFLLVVFFKKYPGIIEEVYSNGIFVGIKAFYSFFLSWIPIPIIYIIVALFLILTIKVFTKRNSSLLSKFRSYVNVISIVICIFYWCWGINYFRIPFQEKVGYNNIDVSQSEFILELKFMLGELDSLQSINKLSNKRDFLELETEMNRCVESTLDAFDYRFLGKSKIRQLYPSGNLLRISTAGIYLPFSFEGHIDGGLHDLQKPFTMIHEFFHGQGFTDEGICNFLAYVATCQTDDPWIRYSGAIGYWRYLQSQGLRSQNDEIINILKELPQGVRKDLIAISEQMKKYPDIMPKVRDKVYDTYLRSNGVKAGLNSYSQMVRYVIKWRG